MSKASEEKLNTLHNAVADALATRLEAPIIHEGQKIEGTEGLGCTAADITAAIAFLKNNNITADPAQDEGLKGLADALAKKREDAKRGLRSIKGGLEDAAEQFERAIGFGGGVQ